MVGYQDLACATEVAPLQLHGHLPLVLLPGLGGRSLPGLGDSSSVSNLAKKLTKKRCQSTAGQPAAIRPAATGNPNQALSHHSTAETFSTTPWCK